MSKIFLDVLNLSIAASWLLGAVFLLRLLIFKKAPKWVSCLLWAVVGLRLVIPFSFESELSLVPSVSTINTEVVYSQETEVITPNKENIISGVNLNNKPTADTSDKISKYESSALQKTPTYIQSGIDLIDKNANNAIKEIVSKTETNPEIVNPIRTFADISSVVWCCGVAVMLIYAVTQYLLLRRCVSAFITDDNGIRRSEYVGSPFILGLFRPRIYLPFGLSKTAEEHIIAHEQAHLKRKDHLIKPFGYLLLSVYWFNPFVWVAYIMLCKDIECACDEKVVKDMDTASRKNYALALVECGVKRSIITACPVAFGEVGVKERVKNTINYKKPMIWIIVVAIIIVSVVAVMFLSSPKSESGKQQDISETISEDVSDEISKNESINESPDEFSFEESFIRYMRRFSYHDFTTTSLSFSLRDSLLAEQKGYFPKGIYGENKPYIIDSKYDCALLLSDMENHFDEETLEIVRGFYDNSFVDTCYLVNLFVTPTNREEYFVNGISDCGDTLLCEYAHVYYEDNPGEPIQTLHMTVVEVQLDEVKYWSKIYRVTDVFVENKYTEIREITPVLFIDTTELTDSAYVMGAHEYWQRYTPEVMLYNNKYLLEYIDVDYEVVTSDILDTSRILKFSDKNGNMFETSVDALVCRGGETILGTAHVCAELKENIPSRSTRYIGTYNNADIFPKDIKYEDSAIIVDMNDDGKEDTIKWEFTPSEEKDYNYYSIAVTIDDKEYNINNFNYAPLKKSDLELFVFDMHNDHQYELFVYEKISSRFATVFVYEMVEDDFECTYSYVISPEP